MLLKPDLEIFRKIGEDKIRKQDLTILVNELINLLEKLINIVDKIEL